jgi:hypothetical protein
MDIDLPVGGSVAAGGSDPEAGITIGPVPTFGYIAAHQAVASGR